MKLHGHVDSTGQYDTISRVRGDNSKALLKLNTHVYFFLLKFTLLFHLLFREYRLKCQQEIKTESLCSVYLVISVTMPA